MTSDSLTFCRMLTSHRSFGPGRLWIFQSLTLLLAWPTCALGVETTTRQTLLPLPAGDHGIAARHPGDLGIEKDPDVIFHDDFETGVVSEKWSNYYQQQLTTYTSDPANVHAGKRALQFTVPKQQAELSNAVDKELKGYDVVFLRYYSNTLKIMRASLDLHIHDNVVRENKKWYDDVVIATSYIGPMVGVK